MTAKDLKNALLQEAVQGKLVPQIASEGNARDLLEEIRNEKAKFVKDGKLKKEKSLPEISEDEIPFDIPENWYWCRLNDLCELIEDCPHSTAKDEGKGFPLIRTPNIGEGRLNFEDVHRVSKKVFNERNFRATPKENDLIFAREAPAGNIAVIQKDEIVCLGQRTVLIRPLHEILNADFLAHYILSPDTQKNLVRKAAGTTVTHVNMSDIRSFPISLPPLAEQKRIVAAIEKFMPLIEEYGKKESVLKAINEQIGALTKKAILQEAVQGKLVPQIVAEGNARDLLEEIRKERLSHGFANSYGICDGKNKKTKKSDLRSKSQISVTKKELQEITEDEIPFDIPESWCWCRLGEIGSFVRGSGIKRTETTSQGFPCVRYGEMYTTYRTQFSKTKSFTSKEVFDKCHKIKKDDILMALTGENKWDIALAAVYQGNDELALGGDLCKFTPSNVYSLFLVYIINSPFGIEQKRNTATGDIIVHISAEKLGNMLIPLPPLAEQKRIVAAIEKMLPLCEKLGE